MATTFNNIQLALDVKAQDRLRKWFADRGSAANLIITSVGLGDSDVDYELSQQYTRMKVLNAPYNVGKIKHHLIYEGQHEKIADGCEVNGFYISAHTGAEIKLNTGKKIFVDRLEFYNCKEGEKVTHRKFIGFSRFSKL